MKNNKGALYVENGISLYHKDLFDLALESYKKAIPLLNFSDLGILYYNMGLCHFSKYNYAAAEKLFKKSFFDYGHKSSGYELAMTLLFNNKLEEGMGMYQYRYYGVRNSFPDLPLPRIKSIDECSNKKVLVLNEQGFGDEFLFSRAIEPLSKLASSVSYQVYPETKRLYESSFKYENIVFFTERTLSLEFVNSFDCYIVTGDLFSSYVVNYGFGYTKIIIQENVKKITEDKTDIGIVCSANKLSKNYSERSIDPVRILDSFKGKENVVFHNLHKDSDIEWMESHVVGDFFSTAILIQSMDYIITVDTAVVHLCGILDKKCYLIYDKFLDWRWVYPFYSSIEIVQIDDLKNKI